MTFWPLTSNSDIRTNQTIHPFHNLDTDLDLHRFTSGFHGAFATGVTCKQGILIRPDAWFRPAFFGLAYAQIVETSYPNLPCLFATFHLEYRSVLSWFCFAWTIRNIHYRMDGCFSTTNDWNSTKIWNIKYADSALQWVIVMKQQSSRCLTISIFSFLFPILFLPLLSDKTITVLKCQGL